MPGAQEMAEKANEELRHASLDQARTNLGLPANPETDPAVLEARQNALVDACQALGIVGPPSDGDLNAIKRDYLSGYSIGLQEALRAAVQSAASRDLAVQLVWMQGPRKLTIYEAADTKNSAGGMSILLEGPMPGQPE